MVGDAQFRDQRYLTVEQVDTHLLSQAVATASAVFMSSTAIASALGGLTGSLGVSILGLPHVFFAPALYGLIATSGVGHQPSPFESGPHATGSRSGGSGSVFFRIRSQGSRLIMRYFCRRW